MKVYTLLLASPLSIVTVFLLKLSLLQSPNLNIFNLHRSDKSDKCMESSRTENSTEIQETFGGVTWGILAEKPLIFALRRN